MADPRDVLRISREVAGQPPKKPEVDVDVLYGKVWFGTAAIMAVGAGVFWAGMKYERRRR